MKYGSDINPGYRDQVKPMPIKNCNMIMIPDFQNNHITKLKSYVINEEICKIIQLGRQSRLRK
jgi:hypothetical protein